MSVIALDSRVFQAVENKLQSFGACGYSDKEHESDFPRRVFNLQYFSGNDIYQIEKYNDVVTKWISEAFRFNKIAYRYRYNRHNEFMADYQPANRASGISLVQCYKFLQCIIYNSDIDSYMETAEFDRFKPEFEAWQEQGRKMLHFMASHIVSHSDDYNEAKWSSL